MEFPTSVGKRLGISDEKKTAQEVKEAIKKGAAYYAVGIPKTETLEQHTVRTKDLIGVIKQLRLRQESGGAPVFIVVMNTPVNIKRDLRRRGITPEIVEEEGERRSRLMGIREVLRCRAIQEDQTIADPGEIQTDWINELRERFGLDLRRGDKHSRRKRTRKTKPVQVALLSEMLDGDVEFEGIHDRVKKLATTDAEFAEQVFKCVKKSNSLPSKYKKCASMEELRRMAGPEGDEVLEYGLYEMATCYLGGVKLGHEGEIPYDSAMVMAMDKLGIAPEDRPAFEVITPENCTGTVPYRGLNRMTQSRDAITEAQDLTLPDRIAFCEKMLWKAGLARGEGDGSGIEAIVNKREADTDQRLEDLDTAIRIRRRMFDQIKKTKLLTEEEKREMAIREVTYRAAEVVMAMRGDEQIGCLLTGSGILDVMDGNIEIAELGKDNLIPFRCERMPEETDEMFLTRYCLELMRGDVLSRQFASHTCRLTEVAYGELVRDLYSTASEHGIVKGQFESRTWDPKSYEMVLFEQNVLADYSAIPTTVSIEAARGTALTELFNQLKGQKPFDEELRQVFTACHEGYPSGKSKIITRHLSGNDARKAQKILKIVESPVFSEWVKRVFNRELGGGGAATSVGGQE